MNYEAERERFEQLFPVWATKLRAATSQDQILEIQEQLLAECRENLRAALQKASATQGSQSSVASSKPDHTEQIGLDAKEVQKLINARNDQIHQEIQKLLDTLERTKNLGETADVGKIALTLMGGGTLANNMIAGKRVYKALKVGTKAVGAVEEGILAAGTGVVMAVAAVVIVAVLMPIWYFMAKDAICILTVINELPDRDLILEGTYDVHGKPVLVTDEIDAVPLEGYAYCGLFNTTKRTDAFVGTQFGFAINAKGATDSVRLAFATECPLTGANNCYCAFDESAESAGKRTAKEKQQYWEVEKGGIRLSIRCNSKSGGVAWYIARVYPVA